MNATTPREQLLRAFHAQEALDAHKLILMDDLEYLGDKQCCCKNGCDCCGIPDNIEVTISGMPFEPEPQPTVGSYYESRHNFTERGPGEFIHPTSDDTLPERELKMDTDTIGGFPYADQNCKGCGKPLTINNAWITDGCPCNTALGVNSMNETRWRLLMELQQKQSHEIERYRCVLKQVAIDCQPAWISDVAADALREE